MYVYCYIWIIIQRRINYERIELYSFVKMYIGTLRHRTCIRLKRNIVKYTLFFLLVGWSGLIRCCRIRRQGNATYSSTTGLWNFIASRNRRNTREKKLFNDKSTYISTCIDKYFHFLMHATSLTWEIIYPTNYVHVYQSINLVHVSNFKKPNPLIWTNNWSVHIYSEMILYSIAKDNPPSYVKQDFNFIKTIKKHRLPQILQPRHPLIPSSAMLINLAQQHFQYKHFSSFKSILTINATPYSKTTSRDSK